MCVCDGLIERQFYCLSKFSAIAYLWRHFYAFWLFDNFWFLVGFLLTMSFWFDWFLLESCENRKSQKVDCGEGKIEKEGEEEEEEEK